eukprot:1157369-Pelagomonas_calceolata.AAC.5
MQKDSGAHTDPLIKDLPVLRICKVYQRVSAWAGHTKTSCQCCGHVKYTSGCQLGLWAHKRHLQESEKFGAAGAGAGGGKKNGAHP